jgi:hypothetical protein
MMCLNWGFHSVLCILYLILQSAEETGSYFWEWVSFKLGRIFWNTTPYVELPLGQDNKLVPRQTI